MSPGTSRRWGVGEHDVTGSAWAGLSGRFEAEWDSDVAVEQVAEGLEFADAPLCDGGQVRLDEGELGEAGKARLQSLEPRCWTLTGRIVRSASFLEKMSRSGRVGVA